jgi:hypothetical protein
MLHDDENDEVVEHYIIQNEFRMQLIHEMVYDEFDEFEDIK